MMNLGKVVKELKNQGFDNGSIDYIIKMVNGSNGNLEVVGLEKMLNEVNFTQLLANVPMTITQ